jgi:hypothetical protein
VFVPFCKHVKRAQAERPERARTRTHARTHAHTNTNTHGDAHTRTRRHGDLINARTSLFSGIGED